ncbi:MAG: AmmeMemoRadiSam system protein A [Armatimonadota bacterium]
MNSPHVMLAMTAIENYLREGSLPGVPANTPSELLATRAGAFVCLKRDGQLRGCIGTIEPVMDNLALEIMENAVSAATRDPRFMPVETRELDGIECSVDVLSPSEQVHDLRKLDPKRYGVIVESGGRRGLLLPDLDGVDTVEQQIDIARRKAYIRSNDPIKLYRFEVLRYY